MELPFRIKFSLSPKLKGYEFPAISKQRNGIIFCQQLVAEVWMFFLKITKPKQFGVEPYFL
ncbi:MAG TPA: hypothetical protein DCM02_02755 [Flavobacterium sp.]|nr:hypothetical protein [Flavobacterium sp.]HAT75991.1 hypothetical protein [Flavobacterium sp.]HAT80142.1 hypothetical protein [Flavobacterium sp.]